jgi:hypothetical protein
VSKETTKMVGYSSFSVNVDVAATRRETMAGQEYLVGPAVIAKEGVMNRVLYTAYELQRSLRTWNGRPVILRHSYDTDGKPISANSPEVINQQGLGFMFNTTWGGDSKLRTEVWLRMADIAAGKIPGIADDGTVSSGMLELSTGIFHQYVDYAGTFDNTEYDIEAYDLVGDHLALLPDAQGAFSVKQGAGFPRWNVAVNENPSAHSPIVAYVRKHKGELVSVGENFFVYSKSDVLYKKGHCSEQGVFRPTDDPEIEVRQTVDFVSTNKQQERLKMPEAPENTTTQKPDISAFTKAEIVAAFNAQVKPEEIVTALSGVTWLADAKALYDAQRKSMIATISANAQNEFSADELGAMPQAMLTKLHKLAVNVAPTPPLVDAPVAPRYDAVGAVVPPTEDRTMATNANDVTPLEEPSLILK